MIIDIFTHILTPRYVAAIKKLNYESNDHSELDSFVLELGLEQIKGRLKVLDTYPDVFQVLSVHAPPLERLVKPEEAPEIAQIANDEMWEIVNQYPKRFTAVACLPLQNVKAAVKEAERAITKLHFKGIQIYTDVNGETLDNPKYRPIFELMSHFDLPIWIHPWNPPDWRKAHFREEEGVAWPFQSTMAQVDLIKTGIFHEYPDIKIIIHHCGALVPFFHHRLRLPIDDFKKFYVDTALSGNTIALNCGYAFYGGKHLLYGTDMRGSDNLGNANPRVIKSIEESDITESDRKAVYAENAKRILKMD